MNVCAISGHVVSDAKNTVFNINGVETPCSMFSVAVNERKRNGEEITTYFEISLWRDYALKMGPWIKRGRRVNVTGNVRLNCYTNNNNEKKYNLRIENASVELTGGKPKEEEEPMRPAPVAVSDPEDLPF